ncbi:ATP-dependent RNA helicase RhlB [Desulfurivibrio sp. D14AmB]|uniref:ATP-dependent RNA helicase RhlB n=1 Tax=Desulfurivibrio sp. D14AmB TaxID=3374370 RepID=UPI00376F35DD
MIRQFITRIRRHLRGDKETPATTATPSESPATLAAAPRPDSPTIGEETTAKPKRRRRRRPRKSADPDLALTQGLEGTDPAGVAAESPAWSPDDFQVPPTEGKTRFHDLDLAPELMRAIHALGFQYSTPIQAQILPPTLAGHDAFGKAQTGTGKSAAFLINIITRLLRDPEDQAKNLAQPRALVLAPTRELAIQIHQDALELLRFTNLNCVAVFGGTDYEKQRQVFAQSPVDILIATPGRLLDFARQKVVFLNQVEVVVIDEADRLLDMGFIPDVRRIIQQTPDKSKRQTLLFSATLTPQISSLAAQWTRDPITVEIEPEQVASDNIEQLVYMVTAKEKMTVLYNLVTGKNLERVIVFCNRRDVTRRVRDRLYRHGISCAMLSGEVSQPQRMKTLENFKEGKIRVLVATDVAGRGLHIEGISHVINYNLPEDAEDYVHRIGRTGRAGASGISVSFADEEESFYLPAIEEYMGRKLSCVYPDDELLAPLPPPIHKAPPLEKSSGGQARGGGRSGGGGRPATRRPTSRSPRRR